MVKAVLGSKNNHVVQPTGSGKSLAEIKVMVCTSAFGMGINQPDVDIVIRVGCPASIEKSGNSKRGSLSKFST